MPSWGSGAFLSGFNQGLLPGLQRGADHITGGWQREDEFGRQQKLAEEQARQRAALQQQKQKHEFGLEGLRVDAKSAMQDQRLAEERKTKRYVADKSYEGTIGAAERRKQATLGATGMRIKEGRRQEVSASHQELQRRIRADLEAAANEGPLSPEIIQAIKEKHMSGLSGMERDTIGRGEVTTYGRPKTGAGSRTAEEQMAIDQARHEGRRELAAGRGLVQGGPSLQHTNPAIYRLFMQQSGAAGAPVPAATMQQVVAEFEKANGRPPSSPAELRDFARGE